MENYLVNQDIINSAMTIGKENIVAYSGLLLKIIMILAIFELIKILIFFKGENKVKNSITNLLTISAPLFLFGCVSMIVSIFYNLDESNHLYGLKYIPYFLFTIIIIIVLLITVFYIFYDKIKLFIYKLLVAIINSKYIQKAINYIKETISIVNEELKNKNDTN